MANTRTRRLLCLIATLTLSAAPLALAEAPATQPDATAQAPTTQPNPAAAAMLQRINDAYAALTFAQFDGHVVGHFDVAGQTKDEDLAFTSSFAAPNRFRHQAKDDVLLGSTGQKVYVYEPQRNVYVQNDAPPAPAGRAALSDWPQAVAGILQSQNPSMLLALTSVSGHAGDAGALAQLGSDVTLLPDTTLGAAHYPTLQFRPPGAGLVTMLLDPQTSMLRQVKFDLREPIAAQGAVDVKAADITIDYPTPASPATRPSSADELAKQFAWTPPANATLASATPPPAQNDAGDAAQALVGKPAPAFTLSDLNDKKVALASTKGKVTILDFWATWCGPCVESLPHLDELYKEESPKGLKVYAVNLQEDKDHVKDFVKQKGWSLPVLLDSTGDVAKSYGADAIPETVIVGKDGKVKDVFVGSGHEDDIKAAATKEMGQ